MRWRKIGSRLASLIATLGLLLAVTFFLQSRSPLDPALLIAGDHASETRYQAVRTELGLGKPWWDQLGLWVARLARGDLGISHTTGQPVVSDLARAYPATLELTTLAVLWASLVGIPLGAWAASRPRGPGDAAVRLLTTLGNSVPIFWSGLLLLALFYAHLHWTAGPGRLDDAYAFSVTHPTGFLLIDVLLSGDPGAWGNAWAHLVLPTLLLGAYALGTLCRLTRSVCLGELRQDYVVFARSKGAGQTRVLFGHVLPNAAAPIAITVGLAITSLLEGAVLTETIFAWPGLGRYLTTALFAADSPAILGTTLVLGASFIVVNGLADLAATAFDPRLS